MSHTPTPEEQRSIAQALVDWFLEHGRDYPWRRTTDPWAILVSEIMLQQTTIPTVLARYGTWMRQFPTPSALAQATEEEALRSWEGLGYYRRVRSLQAAARAIVERHGGVFPVAAEDIRALPGIGEYTVGAVLSFAWNRPAPLVDANVSRVFARLMDDATPIDSTAGRKAHWELAARMVHPTQPRAYNSALMELGQTLCTTGQPTCLLCPIRRWCHAQHPEQLPTKLPKKETLPLEHWDVLCLTPAGLLLERQAEGRRHSGMYRLPQRPQAATEGLEHLADQKYSITRYKVVRHLFRAPAAQPHPGEEFIPLNRLGQVPLASPDRKVLARFLPPAGGEEA